MSARNRKLVGGGSRQSLRDQMLRESRSRVQEGAGFDRAFAERRARQQKIDAQRKVELESRNIYRSNTPPVSKKTNLHDYMVDEINARETNIIDDSNYKFQIDHASHEGQLLNSVGISDKYFFIDTANEGVVEINNEGDLVFNVAAINSLEPIENIIEVEINGISIPFVNSADAAVRLMSPIHDVDNYGSSRPYNLDTLNYNAPNSYFNSSVSMKILEFESQAIIATGNSKFHFLFESERSSGRNDAWESRLKLTPENSKFIFTKPIRNIQTLTFRMFNPINRIPFTQSRIRANLQNLRTVNAPFNTDSKYFILWLDTSNRDLVRSMTPGYQHRIRFTNIDSLRNKVGYPGSGTGAQYSGVVKSILDRLMSEDGFWATMFYVSAFEDQAGFGDFLGLTQYNEFKPASIGKGLVSMNTILNGTAQDRLNQLPPYPAIVEDEFNPQIQQLDNYRWYSALYVPITFPSTNYPYKMNHTIDYFDGPSIFKDIDDMFRFFPVELEMMSRRVSFGIRLRTLRDLNTNYIQPV